MALLNVIAIRAPVGANDFWCDVYFHQTKAFLKPFCGDGIKVIFTFNILGLLIIKVSMEHSYWKNKNKVFLMPWEEVTLFLVMKC